VKRPLAFVLVLAAIAAGVFYTQRARTPGQSAQPHASAPVAPAADAGALPGATLLPGLGSQHFPVSSTNPEVGRWFDQAMMLTYGFNYDAAERSFLRAAQLDPSCAMCWWGAALVLGPHVNAAMDPGNNAKAWDRVQRARAQAAHATPRERAWIEALGARYAANPPQDRKPLDAAYAEAMGRLAAQFPDDLDARVMHAEALMDLQPWDYWDAAGQPKGHTAEVVSALESVMAAAPTHAGALHLYVHAVEASPDPQRGAAAADRLRTLVPGSGHLVHMPAHIYSRVGRWHDAVLANQVAIKADADYLATCGRNVQGLYPLGYVPHNFHFLWFAASMEGDEPTARAAAEQTAQRVEASKLLREEGFSGLQHYWMTPWFERVRFGRWDEIAALPNPAPDLPYPTAIWHYAEGMAAVRQARLDDADAHLRELTRLAKDPAIAKVTAWDRYTMEGVAQVAQATLSAELAAARGHPGDGIAALRQAATLEDAIPYDEPPGWHAPVRQTLGALLLQAGQPADAEQVYREELARNPDNGWSLFGLAQSLDAQKRSADAAQVRERLQAAWKHATVKLASSRM
jgi:tetratricopeptide (TPR) repeat protein